MVPWRLINGSLPDDVFLSLLSVPSSSVSSPPSVLPSLSSFLPSFLSWRVSFLHPSRHWKLRMGTRLMNCCLCTVTEIKVIVSHVTCNVTCTLVSSGRPSYGVCSMCVEISFHEIWSSELVEHFQLFRHFFTACRTPCGIKGGATYWH
jgi:hypothetical protein